jgi:response regulator RpfG family c-di-GMP phosphodiesterase
MHPQYPGGRIDGRRIVICDYNALLLSVTGLLRMSGYTVFQAHDGWAAQELCVLLPNIELLVLNTYGTGIDVGELCWSVRSSKHGLPILHIGSTTPHGLPADVPTLCEQFTAETLLSTVGALMQPELMRAAPLEQLTRKAVSYANGRRREDRGSRSGVPPAEASAPLGGEAAAVRAPSRRESLSPGRWWRWLTSGAAARN